jgi:hypothetical protein
MSTAVLTGQQGFGCFDRVMWFKCHRACVKIFRQSAMIAGARLRSICHPAGAVPDALARQTHPHRGGSKLVVHPFTSGEFGWPRAPFFTAMMQIPFDLVGPL